MRAVIFKILSKLAIQEFIAAGIYSIFRLTYIDGVIHDDVGLFTSILGYELIDLHPRVGQHIPYSIQRGTIHNDTKWNGIIYCLLKLVTIETWYFMDVLVDGCFAHFFLSFFL